MEEKENGSLAVTDDLDDLFVEAEEGEAKPKRSEDKWKILIVDDEPGVHDATILSLMDLAFDNKEISFLQAYSGIEARRLLDDNPDCALMLLDVVMETDNAGLQVVKYVRDTLKNNVVRIVLRTGQPGQAPEDEVIMQYEINDYKAKSELTRQRLFTTVIAALRDYRNLLTIDGTRRGLEQIIVASSSLLEVQSMENFVSGILTQLASLLRLGDNSIYHLNSSFLADASSKSLVIVHGTGSYNEYNGKPAVDVLKPEVLEMLFEAEKEQKSVFSGNSCVAYFKNKTNIYNMVYIECNRSFNEIDRNLVEIFCNNVSMAFENIEKHKIQESLKLANDIQMGMLPKNFSDMLEYEIDLYAFMQPAREVGGDLYDFFFIDEGLLCFVIGDVTDKGVPAALFMAVTKTLFRAVAKIYSKPHEILRVVNEELCRDNEKSMFVTIFMGMLDTRTGSFTYSNGGHNPPYLLYCSGRNDSGVHDSGGQGCADTKCASIRQVESSGGIPLGIMSDAEYYTDELAFARGDTIFLYTDGVTEAMDKENNLFGEDRLSDVLVKSCGKPIKTVVESVVSRISEHTSGAVQSDDITILCVNYMLPRNS